MKEQINEMELEEIESELESYLSHFHVPLPTEHKVEETILYVKGLMKEKEASHKRNIISELWQELKYINIQLLVVQFIILCATLYVQFSFSSDAVLGFVFCIAPLSMVVGLTECLKHKTYQVTELEMTFKHGTGQLFLMRFIVSTVIHSITVSPIVILSGFLNVESVLQLIITWLVPALAVAVIFLGVSFYLPPRINIFPVTIVGWLVGSILLSTQQAVLQKWLGSPVIIHVMSIIILSLSLYKVITKYQEEYSHGVEYSQS